MEINSAGIFEEFWKRLSNAKRRVLFLDYDGTLAPFHIVRSKATPYPGIRNVLKKIIASGTRTVIVSGRPIDDLIPLLSISPLPEVWGTHGLERLRSNGRIERSTLDPTIERMLGRAFDQAKEIAPSDCIESKHGCIALHWRGMQEDEIEVLGEKVRAVWEKFTENDTLKLNHFDGGLEIRTPNADKGFAVKTVIEEEGDDAVAAYLGDDQTDEDAFRALKNRGLTLLVRSEWRETEAEALLRPPDELLWFLNQWLTNCSIQLHK